MFALEFARSVAERGGARESVLPVPASLRELVRDRVAAIPDEVRPMLELTVVLGAPTVSLVAAGLGEDAPIERHIDAAVGAGVVAVDEAGVVRFTHPLIASAVFDGVSPSRRRELHRIAERVVDDEEDRARHVALATPEQDADAAAALERAADAPPPVAHPTPPRSSRTRRSA